MPTGAQLMIDTAGKINVNLCTLFDFGGWPGPGKSSTVGQAAEHHSQANGRCGMDYRG